MAVVTFDGQVATAILVAKVPTQIRVQNRSAADVFISSDKSALDSTVNPATNIPADGFDVAFNGPIITLDRFVGTLYGRSAVSGAALVFEYNESDPPPC